MQGLEAVKEMLKIQGYNGNWNYDPYMHGMFNGLELAVAAIEGREAQIREAPKLWLSEDQTGNPESEQRPAQPSDTTAGSILASSIKFKGYPTLDVIFSHYDAIPHLIDEVKKKGGDLRLWDSARKTKDKLIDFSICDERAAASALSASPGSVFELRDATDDEIYHVVGMFRSKEEALDFIESCEEPWTFCEYADDYAKLVLQEVPFGVGAKAHGDKVWERAWVSRWEDDDEGTWVIYSPNDQDHTQNERSEE